jgi:hypothetical protein
MTRESDGSETVPNASDGQHTDVEKELHEALSAEDWNLQKSWNEDSLKIGLAQLQHLVDSLYTGRDGMAARSGVILGAAAATLAAMLDLSVRFSGTSLELVHVAVILTIACLAIAAAAYSMTFWDYVPDPDFFSKLLTKDQAHVERFLILALREACLTNIRKLNQGGLLVNISLAVLGGALGLAALGVFA